MVMLAVVSRFLHINCQVLYQVIPNVVIHNIQIDISNNKIISNIWVWSHKQNEYSFDKYLSKNKNFRAVIYEFKLRNVYKHCKKNLQFIFVGNA